MEAQQAADMAACLVGGVERVVNSIAVRGRDQVMLKVVVTEVARNIVKQMGIDLSATMTYGTAVVNFSNANPFTAYGRSLVSGNQGDGQLPGSVPSVTATLRAMESAGVVRTLAEPNLTAISGEVGDLHCRRRVSGSCRLFLRPGHARLYDPDQLQEVRHFAQLHPGRADRGPHQPARDDGSLRTVERQFDHAVASRQRHVDELADHSSIKTRRAETTLEIPSGGSMAMAGLIAEQTKQAVNGFPGLTQLPVLGALFRSRDRQQPDRTDGSGDALCLRAVAQKDLSRPDDGFASTSDPQADLLGSINRIYGVPGRVEPGRNYRGTYGFITD